MNSANSTALGGAILAMVGAGMYDSVEEACDKIIKMRDESFTPDPATREVYDKTYAAFDKLYPQLKDNFAEILDI